MWAKKTRPGGGGGAGGGAGRGGPPRARNGLCGMADRANGPTAAVWPTACAAALRAALSRCVQSTANAVADEIADDPEVCEAFGARPLGLAVGFLRTLGESTVDQRGIGESVARPAAAAGGRSPRTA